MASLHFSPLPPPATFHLHRHFAGVHTHSAATFSTARGDYTRHTHLNFRFSKEVSLQVKQRLSPTFASNTDRPDGSDDTKSSDTPRGPPFLTILAGFLVFSAICWVIVSIVMWIIGLIVHPPQPA